MFILEVVDFLEFPRKPQVLLKYCTNGLGRPREGRFECPIVRQGSQW